MSAFCIHGMSIGANCLGCNILGLEATKERESDHLEKAAEDFRRAEEHIQFALEALGKVETFRLRGALWDKAGSLGAIRLMGAQVHHLGDCIEEYLNVEKEEKKS